MSASYLDNSVCQHLLRPIKSAVLSDTDISIKSKYRSISSCGVAAFAGRVREPELLHVWVRVELAAGAWRARDEKFFVRENEC